MEKRNRQKVLLAMMKPGERGEVASLLHSDRQTMLRLAGLGFLPGEQFTLERCRPDYLIRYGYTRVAMNRRVASGVLAYKMTGLMVNRRRLP